MSFCAMHQSLTFTFKPDVGISDDTCLERHVAKPGTKPFCLQGVYSTRHVKHATLQMQTVRSTELPTACTMLHMQIADGGGEGVCTLLRGLGCTPPPLLLTAWRASVSGSTAESRRLLSLLTSAGLMRAIGPSAKRLLPSGLCPAARIKS